MRARESRRAAACMVIRHGCERRVHMLRTYTHTHDGTTHPIEHTHDHTTAIVLLHGHTPHVRRHTRQPRHIAHHNKHTTPNRVPLPSSTRARDDRGSSRHSPSRMISWTTTTTITTTAKTVMVVHHPPWSSILQCLPTRLPPAPPRKRAARTAAGVAPSARAPLSSVSFPSSPLHAASGLASEASSSILAVTARLGTDGIPLALPSPKT